MKLPRRLPEVFEEKFEEVRKVLVENAEDLEMEELWLFGSCARGDFNALSDLDFLVVTKGKHSDIFYKVEMLGVGDELSYPPVDVIVRTKEELSNTEFPFNKIVNEERVVLWKNGGMDLFKQDTYGYLAQKEINAAEKIVDITPEAAVLHAHQALDKIMKHYILENLFSKETIELMHVDKLGKLAYEIGGFKEYNRTLVRLSDFHYKWKYPFSDGFDFDEGEERLLVKEAREIFDKVVDKIKKKRPESRQF